MERTKRDSLNVRKKVKTKKRRLVRSIVAYLKSDAYLFTPLISDFSTLETQTTPPLNSVSPKADDVSIAGLEALGMKKKKRKMSEKVKEYLDSDCYMYMPIISSPKPDSSLKGKLQITNLVTMEVSASTTTMKEDDDYRNLRSDIVEQTLHSGGINSPRRATVILEGKQTGLSPETNLSEEKMAKSDQRRVTFQ